MCQPISHQHDIDKETEIFKRSTKTKTRFPDINTFSNLDVVVFKEIIITLCHLCVQMYKQIFVYESSKCDHLSETIVDIRDAKWFIYIRIPLYPLISIVKCGC